MQIVVCAMAKNEHLYIKDWAEHYLKLGFDKIYIYDNDDIGVTSITEFLPKSDKIVVYDIRGQSGKALQHHIYTQFYNTHKFDWCLFCDIDEFLVGITNVHQWLEYPQYNQYMQIRVKWRLFGDDGLIERDMSQPVYKVFKKEIKSSLNRDNLTKGNLERQAKAIVRGGLPNVIIDSVHYASFGKVENIIPSVLPSGKPCYAKVDIRDSYAGETIFLNHYMTKSLSEFINQKLNRNDAVFNFNIKLNYYWRINEKTKEKIDYLKERNLWDNE